jgi:sRNA-binding protein
VKPAEKCVQNILNGVFGGPLPQSARDSPNRCGEVHLSRWICYSVRRFHASFITVSGSTLGRCDCLPVRRKAKKGAKKKAKRTVKRKMKAKKKKAPAPAPMKAPEPMPQAEMPPQPMPEPQPQAPTETQPTMEGSQPSSSEMGQSSS